VNPVFLPLSRIERSEIGIPPILPKVALRVLYLNYFLFSRISLLISGILPFKHKKPENRFPLYNGLPLNAEGSERIPGPKAPFEPICSYLRVPNFF
jgi:hypothetical protein